MTHVFADACYWVALLDRNDQLHAAATAAEKHVKRFRVVTTDEVLGEFLNYFCSRGSHLRNLAVQIVEGLRSNARVTVVEQSRETFNGGLNRYKQHGDKQWSVVDCISFELMTRDGITDALTNDHHFEQAGFVARLRNTSS